MEHASLCKTIAATILETRLCVHCIAIKTSTTAQDVAEALLGVQTVLTLRIDALSPCAACGSRKSLLAILTHSGFRLSEAIPRYRPPRSQDRRPSTLCSRTSRSRATTHVMACGFYTR